MKAFRWLASIFSKLRQTTSRKNGALILLFGIFLAFFLRNPTIALIFNGKTFDGRSTVLRVILFIFLVLVYTVPIFVLFQLQNRFERLKQLYARAEAILNADPARKVLLACLVLTIIYSYAAIRLVSMDDKAYAGADTLTYQSMGVNLAYGHGLQKFGGLEPLETYQYDFEPNHSDLVNLFYSNAGNSNFARTPIYPLFLGIVYKVFGVHPLIVKKIQLIFLVGIAGFLPFIGYRYWNKEGFVAGIPAGVLFLLCAYSISTVILTEAIVSFTSFLVILALMRYERKPSTFSSILVGVALGYSLLVKGNLYLLPILTAAWIGIRFLKNHDRGEIARLLIITLTAVLLVLPWVTYVSVKSGEFVFITTQSTRELLDDNNERCLNGDWNREWRDDPTAFYNRAEIRDSNDPAFVKVVKFYLYRPDLFPRCMFAKVNNIVQALLSIRVLLIFLCVRILLYIVRWLFKSTALNTLLEKTRGIIPAPFWIITGNLLLITMIFHGGVERYAKPFDFIFELLILIIVSKWGTALREIWLCKQERSIQPPG